MEVWRVFSSTLNESPSVPYGYINNKLCLILISGVKFVH